MPGSFDFESARTFEDYYAPGQMRSETQPDGTATVRVHTKSPFSPSPDAIFPYHLRQTTSKVGIHCPGNIAFTAQYINLMKWTFLSGTLALIRQYHLDKCMGKENNLSGLWDQVDALREINLKIHYSVSTLCSAFDRRA